MLAYGVGNVRHRIGGGPRETAVPIPSGRILSDSRIDLGQPRDRAGHHDPALAEGNALAIEIRYCVLSRHRRESIGEGVSRTGAFRRKGQSTDLRSGSFEARIQIFGGSQTALAR